MHELMTEHITNTDRMNAFWSLLATESSHHDAKPQHKKEVLKNFGKAAEVFEDALIPFIQKIFGYLFKKIRDQDSNIHSTVAEQIGQIIHFSLSNGES